VNRVKTQVTLWVPIAENRPDADFDEGWMKTERKIAVASNLTTSAFLSLLVKF
jgi:hypothetical protein